MLYFLTENIFEKGQKYSLPAPFAYTSFDRAQIAGCLLLYKDLKVDHLVISTYKRSTDGSFTLQSAFVLDRNSPQFESFKKNGPRIF